MKLRPILLIVCFSGLAISASFIEAANACTPAPDNPNGCDGINGGRPKIPTPVCLNCPISSLKAPDKVVLPAGQLNRDILIKKDILQNQDKFNPTLLVPRNRLNGQTFE